MLFSRVIRSFSTTNYYKIFKIPPNFTQEELKTAYLDLVKQYHPDLSKDPNAAEMFRIVQEGYSVLSNSAQRIKHQEIHASEAESSDASDKDVAEEMRKNFYTDYKRKDPINDELNFSYKLFKTHYEKIEQPKAEYQKYEGQNQGYYARKDEEGEKSWKFALAGVSAIGIIYLGYLYTHY